MTENAPPDGPQDGPDIEIFGTGTYRAPSPPKKEFLPWHRPRKQFVRDRQWCGEIGKLLEDSPREGGVLRYLGLPGADLLDLRCFRPHASSSIGLSQNEREAHQATGAVIFF